MHSLFLVVVLLFSSSVWAVDYPVSVPGVSAGSDGYLYFTGPNGKTTIVYPGLSPNTVSVPASVVPSSSTVAYPSSALTAPLNIPVAGVPPGNQLMTIPSSIVPNVARVASVVVGLARIAGPIGMGINLANLVCSTTNICQLPGQNGQPAPNQFGKNSQYTVKAENYYTNMGTCQAPNYCATDAAVISSLNTAASYAAPFSYIAGHTSYDCSGYGYLQSNCAPRGVHVIPCPTGYTGPDANGVCTGPITVTSPTDTDWTAAISSLTAATSRLSDVVASMQSYGQPVPIDKPVLSPASASAPSTTTVTRDAADNVVTTTTNTTNTTVTPNVDASTTNNVTVNQTTTSIVTNSTGGPVSTTTVTNTVAAPAPAPTVKADIKFPDDYNREVTQQAMKADLDTMKAQDKAYQDSVTADRTDAATKAATLATQLAQVPPLPPPADVSHYGIPTQSQFQPSTIDLASKMPSSTPCSPIMTSIMGRPAALDVCPVVVAVKPMVNWMFIVLGAIAGLLVFLSPTEAV